MKDYCYIIDFMSDDLDEAIEAIQSGIDDLSVFSNAMKMRKMNTNEQVFRAYIFTNDTLRTQHSVRTCLGNINALIMDDWFTTDLSD